jgi:hypothetical protein
MTTPKLITPEPLVWPGKWPEEVLNYGVKWTRPLAGDIIVSASVTQMYGHLTIVSQTFVGDQTTFVVSGGKSGVPSLISIIVTTGAGLTLEARGFIGVS